MKEGIFIKKLVLSLCISLVLLPCVPTHAAVIQNEKTETQKQEVVSTLSPYMKLKSMMYNFIFEDTAISNLEQYKDTPKSKKDIVMGLIDYDKALIYVHDEGNRQKSEHIMYHELGHALDAFDELDNSIFKKAGKYSSTDEFKSIFSEEKNCLLKLAKEKYYTDDPGEYFAESFAIYMEFPDLVKKNAPKTYAYIHEKANQQYIEAQTDNKYVLQYKHNFFKENNLNELDNNLNRINGNCFVN